MDNGNGGMFDKFFSPGMGGNKYANPFYGIPLQYLPLNMDGMLWWADHFLMRFGFYRTALSRIANYFITQLNIDCEDEQAKKQYEEIFETLRWKEVLGEAGLNVLGYSNSFISINQGFERFLHCPKCNKFSAIERIDNFKFDKGKFVYTCPSCSFNGVHRVVDKPSRDINKINIVCWNPREIKLRCEETTGSYEYYWDIPETYKKKVTNKNDKFFPKKTPMVIYDAIYDNRMIVFNQKNFIHLKLPTPASLKTDGKAVPLCIYMFDDFFMLKVLERFNEVICYEDINPFRVIAMAPNTMNAQNPVFSTQDGGVWANTVNRMIDRHRRDPASYYTFPFTFEYQQLGGQGKQLAPTELIAQAMNNILNALNIPQELYTMTLQAQAVGPALRLFENSWSSVVDNYNKLLQKIGEVVAKIKGLTPAKISLMPITFADDMERKSVIGQLVSSNSIARSEFLNLYKIDFKDQIRKKMQEDEDIQELQEEMEEQKQLKEKNKASIFNQGQGGGGGAPGGAPGTPGQDMDYSSLGQGTPQDILQAAQQIAQKLQPEDGPARRQELQKIKGQNETLWSAVKAQLQQMDQGAKSQGLQQSKQQGQNGQQQ